MTDIFNLNRFLTAQKPVYASVLNELGAGNKQTHWMWFVFPQIKRLGRSYMASQYAISGPDEAKAYLTHPTLGPRLTECTQIVFEVNNRTAAEIFGFPDVLKFHSSLTLFSRVAEDQNVFDEALGKYYEAKFDMGTLSILNGLA